jgi:hypothetical protein
MQNRILGDASIDFYTCNRSLKNKSADSLSTSIPGAAPGTGRISFCECVKLVQLLVVLNARRNLAHPDDLKLFCCRVTW